MMGRKKFVDGNVAISTVQVRVMGCDEISRENDDAMMRRRRKRTRRKKRRKWC